MHGCTCTCRIYLNEILIHSFLLSHLMLREARSNWKRISWTKIFLKQKKSPMQQFVIVPLLNQLFVTGIHSYITNGWGQYLKKHVKPASAIPGPTGTWCSWRECADPLWVSYPGPLVPDVPKGNVLTPCECHTRAHRFPLFFNLKTGYILYDV